jgi:hypothetical protein
VDNSSGTIQTSNTDKGKDSTSANASGGAIGLAVSAYSALCALLFVSLGLF